MPLFVIALPWDAAEPTPIAMSEPNALGWTPMPTGMVPAVELFKRDSPANLCGYVDGDQSDSVYCPSTLSCIFNTNAKAVGCCSLSETDGALYTKCYNSADIVSGLCNAACAANTFIRQCSLAAYPWCYTYSYPEVGYINLGCGTSSYSSNVLTTYSGQASGSIVPGSSSSSSSVASSTTSSSGSSATTDPASASTTSSASSGGSSTNVGAIAGCVVSGLAVLGVIAALIFAFLSRRKSNSSRPAFSHPTMSALPHQLISKATHDSEAPKVLKAVEHTTITKPTTSKEGFQQQGQQPKSIPPFIRQPSTSRSKDTS